MAEKNNIYKKMGFSNPQGLYDPKNEHDACGFGFIANIDNEPKHEIVHQALDIVHKLDHRGAIGADPLAGDGAGILIQIPDEFLECTLIKMTLNCPLHGEFAVEWFFCQMIKPGLALQKMQLKKAIAEEGQILIGWRDVPIDNSVLGESVKKNKPIIKQFFIQKGDNCVDENMFQRKLYVIRKQSHQRLHKSKLLEWEDFYIVSLSTRTIIFKGMVLAPNLSKFYVDFQDKNLKQQ